MIKLRKYFKYDVHRIPVDCFWNSGDEKELQIHRIHAYPAKFPAFIATKALDYARRQGVKLSLIADIFCGCGTVAFEAKRNGIAFWGCDINPTATLIAKAKSNNYKTWRLIDYFEGIIHQYNSSLDHIKPYSLASERIRYWYDPFSYRALAKLRLSIDSVVPTGSKYHTFFLAAFSNILKPASRWLTKSIKPQLDPEKDRINNLKAFHRQCRFSILSYVQCNVDNESPVTIKTANFLCPKLKKPKVDMIITSPPYVTSYEYADLHQLSSLWLFQAKDYRDLRIGSIGSYHTNSDYSQDFEKLTSSGRNVVAALKSVDHVKAKAVARYFVDMQRVGAEAYSMLKQNGIALFLIGNTRYSGVRVDNARHLLESLLEAGFFEAKVTKRKVSKKILTPYRDARGRFTTDARGRKVYHEEYIIIVRKGERT